MSIEFIDLNAPGRNGPFPRPRGLLPVPPEVERLGSTDEVRRCIAGLSTDRSEALLLHHEWGFSFEEIAGMLGISAAAARARASRGMAELRGALVNLKRVSA